MTPPRSKGTSRASLAFSLDLYLPLCDRPSRLETSPLVARLAPPPPPPHPPRLEPVGTGQLPPPPASRARPAWRRPQGAPRHSPLTRSSRAAAALRLDFLLGIWCGRFEVLADADVIEKVHHISVDVREVFEREQSP